MNTTTTSAAAAELARQKAAETALGRVCRAWGTSLTPEALKATLPLLYGKLEAAKEHLDTTWENARAGRASTEQFDYALKTWECTNYAAVTALKAVR